MHRPIPWLAPVCVLPAALGGLSLSEGKGNGTSLRDAETQFTLCLPQLLAQGVWPRCKDFCVTPTHTAIGEMAPSGARCSALHLHFEPLAQSLQLLSGMQWLFGLCVETCGGVVPACCQYAGGYFMQAQGLLKACCVGVILTTI